MGAILLDVTIPGCPRSQRSQVVVRKTKDGRHFPSLAKDASTEEWRSIARLTVQEAWGGKAPIDEPVRLTIWAVGTRPKGAAKWLGTGRYWRTTKPDWDNVGKASDVLVKVGVLRDDVLVGDGRVLSLVAGVDEAPHVRIRVEALDPLPIVPWPEKTRAKSAPATPCLDL